MSSCLRPNSSTCGRFDIRWTSPDHFTTGASRTRSSTTRDSSSRGFLSFGTVLCLTSREKSVAEEDQDSTRPTCSPIWTGCGILEDEWEGKAAQTWSPSTSLVTWHINDKYTFYDSNEVDAQPYHWDGSPHYHGLHLPPDFTLLTKHSWLGTQTRRRRIVNQLIQILMTRKVRTS